jgi:hypothetical protein
LVEIFDVSDVTIGKKCNQLEIQKPSKGFWNKVDAEILPHPNGKITE